MIKDDARRQGTDSRAAASGGKGDERHLGESAEEDGLFPASLLQSTGSAPPPAAGQGVGAVSDPDGLVLLPAWPEQPELVDPGELTRADRLRMLQRMREVWGDFNGARRTRVKDEVGKARERQAEVTAYWNRHRVAVKEQWDNRTGGRGETTVADVREVADQWHPDNPHSPERVSATAQQRGAASPYFWQCPLGLGHKPWRAWPKDRIQKGAGCPACQKLIKLSDIPTLAEQYRGSIPPTEITYGANNEVPWVCRTWALNPETGEWHRVEHHFEAVVKDRSQQGHGCRVCAGYVIDDTNSLATWFPELAEQLDDPQADPRRLATSTHNVSRKVLRGGDTEGEYADRPWRCRHGHRWRATILNRVQGGDCPDCSTSGISKEQVRLVAELAWLMGLLEPEQADPRLPAGVSNFASHKIAIPTHLKPAHWRYKDVEVDARFVLSSQHVIGVEYDGAYHHSGGLRERTEYEVEKSKVLREAGAVSLVVHVRVGNLPPLQAPHALTVPVPERSTPYQQACAVAAALEARYPGSIPKLTEYLAGQQARGQAQAEDYVLAVWGQLRPPRPKPQRTAQPRQRQLKATNPHPDSLLTPLGNPYKNPERPTEILRDYRCACGTQRKVTAIQSQVTSGNTRSCGCLKTQAGQQKQRAVSRAETQAARQWARQKGMEIGLNGRVSDRILASYRLHQAGCLGILGTDGLLEEKRVQEWAQANDRPLAARGKVASGLWTDFAEDHLEQHGSAEE